MPPNPATRRVVVTGLGTVNPLGNNVPSSWDRLLTGESAVDWVPEFVDAGLPVQIGATVSSDFDPAPFLSNSRAESVRFVALAMALFVMAFVLGFNSTMATLVTIAFIIGCVLLAPSIILGYAVKAAEREDRENGL